MAACDSAAGLAEPEGAVGYPFALAMDEPVVYRWPVGSTIHVYVAGGEMPARAEMLADALAAAAAEWTSALGPAGVDIVETRRLEDADVVLRWSDAAPPVDTAACPPEVTGRAATTFCRTADGTALRTFPLLPPFDPDDGAVRMLVTVLASEAGSLARVRQLVGHELGHVLGIGTHSPDPADLMWGGELSTIHLSEADRETIHRLYETTPDLLL